VEVGSYDWDEHFYQEGVREGKKEGTIVGGQAGYDLAYPIAYELAYQPAFGNGRVEGDAQGLLEGSVDGFDEGWDEGLSTGNAEGFDAGTNFFYASLPTNMPVGVRIVQNTGGTVSFSVLQRVPSNSSELQAVTTLEPSSLLLAGIAIIPLAISRRRRC